MLLWQGNSTYDTEADKRRLRNIRHDNKQDIDFWKLCIIKQENTQDNKQDEMLRGEKLWQIILHRLRYKHNVGLRCIYIGENRKNECIKKFGSKTSFKKEQ